MNKFKKIPPPEQPVPKESNEREKKSRPVKSNKIIRSVLHIVSGNFLSKNNVISLFPFFLFLTLIGLGYIANGYYAEKSVREISRINTELKELKSEYITTKSELMFMSNQSELARAAAPLGLKESTAPPKKIVIKINNIQELSDN